MRKWFVVAINVLLAGFIILIWRLNVKQGTGNYQLIVNQYVPKILFSFAGLTFMLLLFSWTGKKNRR